MVIRLLRAASVVAVVTIPCSYSGTSAAQSRDLDAEYKAALAARDAGDYAVACPRLDEIVRLRAAGAVDPTKGLGGRYELAVCYEGQGKLASAVEQYALVQTLAAAAGQRDREEKARAKVAALQPRLALLTLIVPAGVAVLPGVAISLDQKVIDRKHWGTPMPVDPGKHSITATAPGRSAWHGDGDISANGTRISIEVQVPPPEAPAPSVTATPKPSEAPPSQPLANPPVADPEQGQRLWQRPLAYGLLGLGAVGLGVGIGLAVDAAGKLDASKPHCQAGTGTAPDVCTDTGFDLRSAGRVSADISTVMTIAGGVLMAGGLVVWLTAPSQKNLGRSAHASFVPLQGGGLASFRRHW